jgi:hypothetical protein
MLERNFPGIAETWKERRSEVVWAEPPDAVAWKAEGKNRNVVPLTIGSPKRPLSDCPADHDMSAFDPLGDVHGIGAAWTQVPANANATIPLRAACRDVKYILTSPFLFETYVNPLLPCLSNKRYPSE